LLDETNTNKGSSLPKKPSSESLSLNGDYSCRENSTPIDFPDEILNEYRKKCPILYQDSSCVIVNKDFSMLVFPVSKELDRKEPTLVELFPKLLNKIKGLYPAVHRLDRETSGTIAIAETEGSYHQLKQIFFDRSHRLKKGYIAVGFDQRGMLTPGAEYIVTDQIRKSYFHKEGQQELCADGGRRAESRFRVLSKTGDLVILWVEIITGVQHQIRVHSSQSLGAPLVGDNTYGSCRFNYSRAHRPLLHAFMLAFEGSQRDICVYAPLPEDMHVVIELNFKLGLRISQSRILLHPNTEELESNETETVSPSFLKPTPTLFRFFTQLYPLSPVTNAGFRVLSKISDPKYILPVNDLGNSTAGQSF
jgi:23S rRNA-/tRNA-specific pseudouridylate synthase